MKQLLCLLADPEAREVELWDLDDIEPCLLFKALRHHGVEPVGLRRLKPLMGNSTRQFIHEFDKTIERQFVSNALAMELEVRGRSILQEMQTNKVRGVVVKGPDFATNLYDRESDRPFTDIDLLVEPDDLIRLGSILKNAGYNQKVRNFWDQSATNMEQKWTASNNENILIELHTNLVHDAALRRRISFGYAEFSSIDNSSTMSPLSRLMVSVIHAGAGHKFHKLQMLVDVLQAYRRLGEMNIGQLQDITETIPANLEISISLHLVSQLFQIKSAANCASQFQTGKHSLLVQHLINADVILDTFHDPYKVSRLRRHLFRFLQKYSNRC